MTEFATLSAWHDFFLVMGAASGTLIGAMFVVVSIGNGIVTKERAMEGRIFLTPTIVHLAVVLLSCGFMLVPSLTLHGLGLGFAAGGLIGLAYAGRNGFHIGHRDAVEWSDHLWYGAAPVVAYLTMLAGAALILAGHAGGIETIAAALALLVAGGIRNAWDLILFFVGFQRETP